MRLNTHLGAGVAMSTERIQDPKGAKTIILSIKATTGATLAISRHDIKVVRITNAHTGRLRIDVDAT
jgi:hypothetical protein